MPFASLSGKILINRSIILRTKSIFSDLSPKWGVATMRATLGHVTEHERVCMLSIAPQVQKWYTLTGHQRRIFVVPWARYRTSWAMCCYTTRGRNGRMLLSLSSRTGQVALVCWCNIEELLRIHWSISHGSEQITTSRPLPRSGSWSLARTGHERLQDHQAAFPGSSNDPGFPQSALTSAGRGYRQCEAGERFRHTLCYRQRTGRLAMLATGEYGFLVGMHTAPGSGITHVLRGAQTA